MTPRTRGLLRTLTITLTLSLLLLLAWSPLVAGLRRLPVQATLDAKTPERIVVGQTYVIIWDYTQAAIMKEVLVIDHVGKDGWALTHSALEPGTQWWVNLNQAKALINATDLLHPEPWMKPGSPPSASPPGGPVRPGGPASDADASARERIRI